MRKIGVCLALAVAVLTTGCGMQLGGQSSSRGGIAVVDLDKVAADTNRKLEMDQSFEMQQNAVNQQLVKLQTGAKELLEKKNEELGEDATEAEKQKVAQMTLNARNNLTQVRNAYATELNKYKQVQIATFRNEIKPILQDVAAKRGLAVVIPKNDGLLLSVDPGVDITDEVIKAYREKKLTAPAAAAPAVAKPAETAKAPEKAPEKAPRTASKAADKDGSR